MKILQVAQFFSPMHGGSAEVPHHISNELAKRRHEITIYASDYKSSREYIHSIPEVEVCLFKSWLNYAKFHVTPGIIKRAKKEIKHFDIIHMHNYRTFQNIVVYHYARKYKIPYVLQAHGSVLSIFQRERLKKIFDILFGNKILKDASKLIAVAKIEAEQYKKMGVDGDKVEIIPNGIDMSKYEDLPKRGDFREKYLIGEDEKLILYLGRIHKSKGIDLLVNAFVDLVTELDNVRLVITGPDDGFLPKLKKQIDDLKIGDKILSTGPLYGMDKLEAYVDADVYVLPSVYEIFGITVLEACACSTPVIVTDNCGCGELVRVANCGYSVKYGDVNDLKKKMKYVIENPEEGKEMVERGKKYIEENLTWDTVVRRVEVVYEDCIHHL